MAEAFFHRKTAVVHYFQLAIEILTQTRSRKPLCTYLPQPHVDLQQILLPSEWALTNHQNDF